MSNISSQQMAELLLGIARAQQAIIDALENSKAGFKSTHFRPALETASRIRSNRAETLTDFPARLLLLMLGRNAPDIDQVSKSLEALIAGNAAAPGAAAETAPAAGADAGSLDMTQS